jgi:hypothetical protein
MSPIQSAQIGGSQSAQQQPPGSAEDGLQWVNVNRPGARLDSKQRSSIRSHVMKRYKHEQDQQRKEKRKQLSEEEITPLEDSEDDLALDVGHAVHQPEALTPELAALANAFGLDLDEERRFINKTVSTRSTLDKRRASPTDLPSSTPGSQRLGYSPILGEEYVPPLTYCITCGAPDCMLHRIARQARDKPLTRDMRPSLSSEFRPSPLELLGSGRRDAFDIYPVKDPKPYLHELMDHSKISLLL